ncbi:MAG: hypothetical protein GXP48_03580 [Acidobacteria bacterium]|nr:hypothetical protein [Acidobacteriota bacterium]
MKKVVFGMVALLVSGVIVAAGSSQVVNVTRGQFAQLLLNALATKEAPQLSPAKAMSKVQELGLMPESWKAATLMNHADLALVFHTMGISYVPNDPEAPLSRLFAEALLRRYRRQIVHQRGWVLGHGFSPDNYLDGDHGEGVLSPSKF